MAKVDIKMPDEFLEKISRLGKDFDDVAEKVLEAGGEVVLKKVKSKLSSVVGSGTKYDSRSTGELESALGLTSVKPNQINRSISMKKADEKLLLKKEIFKAWTGILLAKGIIDPTRHNQMISIINKMSKEKGCKN